MPPHINMFCFIITIKHYIAFMDIKEILYNSLVNSYEKPILNNLSYP